jgi:hypothetical protein
MKTENKIAIAAAVGVAGFLIWKNWDKIKGMFKKEGEAKKDTTEKPTESGATNTSNLYKSNVMMLQQLLGVSIDGIAGKQTNGKLEYYFCDYLCEFDPEKAFTNGYPSLKKNGMGVVSPINIIFYIKALNTANTPRQLLLKGLNVEQQLKEFKRKLGL